MKLVAFLMNLPHATRDQVTVELKNGTSVKGEILSCSPVMNISMKNVKLSLPHQDPQQLQFMNIRGNQVRQVLLPDELNIEHVLETISTKTFPTQDAYRTFSGSRGRGGRGISRGSFGGRGRGSARGGFSSRARGGAMRGRGAHTPGFRRGGGTVTGSNSQPLGKRFN